MDLLSEEKIIKYSELELLTAVEVAELLKVDPSTIYGMLRSREIPGVKFGRSVRIRRIDLEKFIKDHSGPGRI